MERNSVGACVWYWKFPCGILKRKLSIGMTETEAAETLFGIDILADNIEESIQRLTDLAPTAESIFRKNIVQGNFLKPEGIWFLEDAE